MINLYIQSIMDETKKCKERFTLYQELHRRKDIFHHSVNVMMFSLMIGKRLKLNHQQMMNLGAAALFHDVGKLDIEDCILYKPGRLSDDEYRIIKMHSELGYNRLMALKDEKKNILSTVALQHHERNDGSGYPQVLKTNKIHPLSKIVAIVDVYDALTEERVYRKRSFTSEEAMSILRKGSGIQFESDYLAAFSQALRSNIVKTNPYGALLEAARKRRAI
ncbi:HD-GYP domain-containing protein [Pseudobacillus badius]|uniref:HD-GYP domain-containing protein n=1 Tax=Bacillus badius TaxID=1455 RepID=UPI003D336A36